MHVLFVRQNSPTPLRRVPTRRAAFTLVELLVVVGIISVLIAILLPALNKAREQANRIKCAANLRSIGQALTMYTQTYGYYPGGSVSGPSGGSYALWPVRLRRFTGSQGVFNCPSQDSGTEWGYARRGVPATAYFAQYGYEEGEPMLDWATAPFSYGYNVWGTTGTPTSPIIQQLGLGNMIVSPDVKTLAPPECYRELRASRVRTPSEMIAVADSTPNAQWDAAIVPAAGYGMFINNTPNPLNPGAIHAGGANVLYCDGHVQWSLQKELLVADALTPENNVVRSMWNNNHAPYLGAKY